MKERPHPFSASYTSSWHVTLGARRDCQVFWSLVPTSQVPQSILGGKPDSLAHSWRGTRFPNPILEWNQVPFPILGGEPGSLSHSWIGTRFSYPFLERNQAPLEGNLTRSSEAHPPKQHHHNLSPLLPIFSTEFFRPVHVKGF